MKNGVAYKKSVYIVIQEKGQGGIKDKINLQNVTNNISFLNKPVFKSDVAILRKLTSQLTPKNTKYKHSFSCNLQFLHLSIVNLPISILSIMDMMISLV